MDLGVFRGLDPDQIKVRVNFIRSNLGQIRIRVGFHGSELGFFFLDCQVRIRGFCSKGSDPDVLDPGIRQPG